MKNILGRFYLTSAHHLKVVRAAARLTKAEKTKVTQSEVIRRLIEKGLTPKGEFVNDTV